MTEQHATFKRDPGGLPDLGALVEQAPMATVYCDAELRFIKVNDEFCRFVRLPREAILGHRVIEVPAAGFDMIMIDRVLTGQVLAGVPLLDWPLEQTIDGVRRVYAWSAFRVADRGRVLGALGWLTDVTERERAAAALEQARARLDLLARASSDIGTTLDIRQTCAELAHLAVPEVADRISIELLDQVLRGEDTGRDQPGTTGFVRLRRLIMRDVQPGPWSTTGRVTRSSRRSRKGASRSSSGESLSWLGGWPTRPARSLTRPGRRVSCSAGERTC